MDIILTSIKHLLGIEEDYTHFDIELMMHINSALMELQQIGVGPESGFKLVTGTETWSTFLSASDDFEGVKTYVYYTVRLGFDPPAHGFLIDAMDRQRKELTWRLNVQATPEPVEE